MGNTNVASRRSYERRTFDYFDRLPAPVREAIANARFDWAVGPWHRAAKQGASDASLVAAVKQNDLLETAKTRFRAWGGEYPIFEGEISNIPLERKSRRSRR